MFSIHCYLRNENRSICNGVVSAECVISHILQVSVTFLLREPCKGKFCNVWIGPYFAERSHTFFLESRLYFQKVQVVTGNTA